MIEHWPAQTACCSSSTWWWSWRWGWGWTGTLSTGRGSWSSGWILPSLKSDKYQLCSRPSKPWCKAFATQLTADWSCSEWWKYKPDNWWLRRAWLRNARLQWPLLSAYCPKLWYSWGQIFFKILGCFVTEVFRNDCVKAVIRQELPPLGFHTSITCYCVR